jgi:hypothetical protein
MCASLSSIQAGGRVQQSSRNHLCVHILAVSGPDYRRPRPRQDAMIVGSSRIRVGYTSLNRSMKKCITYWLDAHAKFCKPKPMVIQMIDTVEVREALVLYIPQGAACSIIES